MQRTYAQVRCRWRHRRMSPTAATGSPPTWAGEAETCPPRAAKPAYSICGSLTARPRPRCRPWRCWPAGRAGAAKVTDRWRIVCGAASDGGRFDECHDCSSTATTAPKRWPGSAGREEARKCGSPAVSDSSPTARSIPRDLTRTAPAVLRSPCRSGRHDAYSFRRVSAGIRATELRPGATGNGSTSADREPVRAGQHLLLPFDEEADQSRRS